MSDSPADLKYTKSHEWVRTLADGNVEVGITDHAQGALGDLVFVEVPEAGKSLKAGDSFAVVESVKAASDVYAPIAGAVLEGRVEPAIGLVGQRPGAERPDDVRGGRVVGDHEDLRDRRAGEGGGHGVGEQRQHQVVVGGAAERIGQRPQARLREGEPLGRDDDRPLRHGSM